MENDQKSLGIVKILIVSVAAIVLVLAGLVLWSREDKSSQADTSNPAGSETGTSTCPSVRTSGSKSSQLPSGWQWHEVRDAGVKYAYPEDWTSPTDQTNSGVEKYVASFTVGKSSTTTMVTLSPDCSDFQTTLSDINNGTFDTTSGPTITKVIQHDQSSYASLSHWSTDAGNQYQLAIGKVINVGTIKSVIVEYDMMAGSETCPDDKLASNEQKKCITQSIGDEIDQVISSLQKL